MPPPGLGVGGTADTATCDLGFEDLAKSDQEVKSRVEGLSTWSQNENPRPWFPAAKSAGGTAPCFDDCVTYLSKLWPL